MSDFQQILLRDLPLSPGTAAPYTLVAVDGNRNSVRVPASVLTNASVTLYPNAPAALSSPGSEGSLAFSCPSLYSYYNGQWGASPRYTKNIEDLDKDTRFLLVNKEMNLTAAEKSSVMSSLGIAVASTDTAGLVFGSSQEKDGMVAVTVEDGHMYVRNATAVDNGVVTTTGEEGPVTTKEYVDTQIEGLNRELVLPIATTGTIGGVLSGGDGDIFRVSETGAVSIREATNSVPGIVTVASANEDAQLESVVPLKLMRSVIEDVTAGTVPYATYTEAGIVKVAGSASGPTRALYFTDAYGTLDVYTASNTRLGVVKLANTIPTVAGQDDPVAVPNTQAVRSYVQTVFAGDDDGSGGGVFPPTSIPKATTGSIGGIIVGSRLSICSNGLLNVPIAAPGQNNYGVVKLASTIPDEAAADEESTVPTTQAVRNYVISSATGGEGGTIDPIDLPKASTTTIGAVSVGSRLTINTSTGEINVKEATTSNAGIVQLSNSYTSNNQSTAATSYAIKASRDDINTWLNGILTCLNSKIDSLSSRVTALEQ